MSVHVTDTTTTPWQYAHDEGGHSGDFDPATLAWGTFPDGTEDRTVRVVLCPYPSCGSASYWPRETLEREMAEADAAAVLA